MVETMATRAESRMKALGLRPVDLAKKIKGMSESAVSQFFAGTTKTLRPENLIDMADALECSPRWIVYGGEMAPSYNPKRTTHPSVSELVAVPPVRTIRSTVDDLGDALDACTIESRTAVAGLLQQYALSPKPGAIADAIVMFLDRCNNPNADNPWAGAAPGQAPNTHNSKKPTGAPR